MGQIIHENPHGVKMERIDYKKRSKVRVFSTGDKGQEYLHKTYRFNNISENFRSPFLSWANLDCCGGWRYDENYLMTSVQEGKKLFASIALPVKGPYTPSYPTREERIRDFEEMKKNLPFDIVAGIEENLNHENYFHYFVCRNGKISDYFNIDEVFRFYDLLERGFVPSDENGARKFCEIEIKTFGSKNAPFKYFMPLLDSEIAVNGLLLGYPIESTVSFMAGW